MHLSPCFQYNAKYDTAISCDTAGILEYWRGPAGNYASPNSVSFSSKLDTDLFEFVKAKTSPMALCVSPTGREFATLSIDRKVSGALLFFKKIKINYKSNQKIKINFIV